MGKQINSWMEYENFQQLADVAISHGLSIVAWNDPQNYITNVQQIPQNVYMYYFHLPTLEALKLHKDGTVEKPFWRVDQQESPIIEAGYSNINMQSKTMTQNRIYVQTGHYDEIDVNHDDFWDKVRDVSMRKFAVA